jgi:hypothetical protein
MTQTETSTRQGDEAQLKEEIERTREQLGETVGELAARLDVKSRVRAQASELTGRARNVAVTMREQAAATRAKTGAVPWVVAAGTVALVVAELVIWRRGMR